MRSSIFSLLVFLAFAPVALADTSCTTTLNGQTVSGLQGNGTCIVSCTTVVNGVTVSGLVANDKCVPTTSSTNTSNQGIGALCLQNSDCSAGLYCNTKLASPDCEAVSSGSIQTTPNNIPSQTQQTPNNVPGGTNVTLINPLNSGNCAANGNCLMVFLGNILAVIIRIGTIVVILMLVFVGYKFVVAQGEPGKLTEARSMLLWTVVGALILLGAQAIAIGITATVQALSGG